MAVVWIVVGVFLIALVLLDAFESVVLPRRVTRPYRLTRIYYRSVWRLWSALADACPTGRVRNALLSVFGPLSLLCLMLLWAACLIVGFGLLHEAVSGDEMPLARAIYLSGTTFTTLGYGDVTPTGAPGRVLAVIEALTGFGFLAVVIGYLPIFYQSFSRRELTISLLDARAGSPPSAGEMFTRLPPREGQAVNRFLEDAERWSAELLESLLSYPILCYYRSQHDNQSWLGTLVCTLDASALLLTVASGANRQQARLTFAMARHTIVDVAVVFQQSPRPLLVDRLPSERLDALFVSLRSAGWTVRSDEDAVTKFTELRGLYEPYVEAMGRFLRLDVPPIVRAHGGPDNWQTSAGMRRAAGLAHLAAPGDDHFV